MSVRPSILVVDDDRAILTLVGSVALAEGFDVATTIDGSDALQQLATRPADLVLVDLLMPGFTGLEVLRAIRSVNARCRVVLMSGHATIDSAVTAVKLGATDYLTKPLRIGNRIVTLQHALGARVNELQQALSNVRALSGLLPICAYRKRIRDDKDYWLQIEHYLSVHSDARFSHGICPDCFKKHAED